MQRLGGGRTSDSPAEPRGMTRTGVDNANHGPATKLERGA